MAADEQRRPLAVVGEALIEARRAVGRKPSTIEASSCWLRIQTIDHFGTRPVGEITCVDVRGFAAALARTGLAPSHVRTQRPTTCCSSSKVKGCIGRFGSTRTGERRWILVKANDEYARPASGIVTEEPASVRNGLS
jgi:hypothetical protein